MIAHLVLETAQKKTPISKPQGIQETYNIQIVFSIVLYKIAQVILAF